MKSPLTKLFSGLIVLLLVWAGTSWWLADKSKQHFAMAIQTIEESSTGSFLEAELLSHNDSFFGSSSVIKLIPTSPLIDESIESQRFLLKKSNGPIFINQEGVQFGISRWELSIIETESNPTEQLLGNAIVSFSESLDLTIKKPALTVANWSFKQVAVAGTLDFTSASFDIEADVFGLAYRHPQFLLSFEDVKLKASSRNINESPVITSQIALNTRKGELSLRDQQKRIPFTLQSNGSIWAKNDTLSGDLQIKSASEEWFKSNSTLGSEKTDDLVLDLTLQFREFLTNGLWQAVETQSEVFSLLQQAEWAMDDIETPEQQDFLRSLFLEASRISLAQLEDPFGPMLIANRSKLAANANVSQANSDLSSQFTLGGLSSGGSDKPILALKGEMKVDRQMLNEQARTLFDRWSNRRWFRQYETEFETDVAIRNQRLLLNNFLVSVDGLEAELSQAMTDQ